MHRLGLIGKTLSHSFSKTFFEEKFRREGISDYSYDLFEIPEIQQITDFIRQHPDLKGFNVTIPYKQTIIPFLDELSQEAAAIGAVNAVFIKRNGNQILTKGFNTDAEGFLRSIDGHPMPSKAMVLGTGGAAAAISYVLENHGCACTFVSRDPKRGLPYSALTPELVREHPLIVNCTPLGTSPNINEKPDIPYEGISGGHFLYDLVYNPSETAFLKEGIRRGAMTQNGLAMLHAQAEAAWSLFRT
ncbi:MAG: shikimate dehydrogenase [Bacteroidales bacterium]|nr:shikimate dehydrogenase [Bacteroidales bacterium]